MLLIFLSACLKQRDLTPSMSVKEKNSTIRENEKTDPRGVLKINEIMARGSGFFNELIHKTSTRSGCDWVELYNTGGDTLLLEKGKWFITESVGDNKKFEIPAVKILPYGHLILWCDGMDTTVSQIHTNFSLSKDGENLWLFYQADAGLVVVDHLSFSYQESNTSIGRKPDGSEKWITFSRPSPGRVN